MAEAFFTALYGPNTADATVTVNHYPKEIEVAEDGAYSIYNWELFFHVPLTIVVHLSKNQRSAEAQRWFHYIFDPTAKDGKVWRLLAFRQGRELRRIASLLRLVSDPGNELSKEEQAERPHPKRV